MKRGSHPPRLVSRVDNAQRVKINYPSPLSCESVWTFFYVGVRAPSRCAAASLIGVFGELLIRGGAARTPRISPAKCLIILRERLNVTGVRAPCIDTTLISRIILFGVWCKRESRADDDTQRRIICSGMALAGEPLHLMARLLALILGMRNLGEKKTSKRTFVCKILRDCTKSHSSNDFGIKF